MHESRKRNVIIASLCGVLLLMAVGYAAFQSVLNIEGTANITSNWDIKITNIEEKEHVGSAESAEDPTHEDLTATFSVNLVSPGDSISYDVTIENQGSLDAELARIKVNKGNNPAIKFETEGIEEGSILQTGGTATLNVKITYDESVTSQPDNTSATFKVTLDYVQQGHKSEWSPNDTVNIGGQNVKVVTEGDGLYEDPNPEEGGRYVYSGENPNNYITFNGEVAGWRIVSVESDGTLKIMRATALPEKRVFDTSGLRDFISDGAGGTYCAQSENGCNVWAKTESYTSANGEHTGSVLKDSKLKEYLNGDYYNSIQTNKDAIQEHDWYYGSTYDGNLEYDDNGDPTKDYASQYDLSLMVKEEKRYSAKSNIGLIQTSDVIKANSNRDECRNAFSYFENHCTTNYFTWIAYDMCLITPLASSVSDVMLSAGLPIPLPGTHSLYVSLFPVAANEEVLVFPSIYLKSTINLSGTGSQEDPYKIE